MITGAGHPISGKSIVFLSDRGGSRQVWTIGADGSHPVGLSERSRRVPGERIVSTRNDIVYFALDHLFRAQSQREWSSSCARPKRTWLTTIYRPMAQGL